MLYPVYLPFNLYRQPFSTFPLFLGADILVVKAAKLFRVDPLKLAELSASLRR